MPLIGPAGHVGVAFEDPKTGKFTCGGVENPNSGFFVKGEGNGGWSKPGLTLEEVINEFHNRGYDGIRIIQVKDAHAKEASDSIETFPYRGFVGGLNDCLTSTDEVLNKYGVKDRPSVFNLAPITYYEKTKGEEYLWNDVENTYTSPATGNSLTSAAAPAAAVDALSVGTPQSPVTWQDTSKSNTQGTTQTTSQSTNTKFAINNKIETTNSLNVRSGPGLSYDTVSETKAAGSTGTILKGPVYADGFTWWQIQYDDGTNGWSEDKRLESRQVQDQSISNPWQNLETGSSVTDHQSTPVSTGQTTNTKFAINNKVETTNSLNVRSGPGLSYGTVSETKTTGSTGTIEKGPIYADGFTWWQIQYDDGTNGWSEDKRLELLQGQDQSTSNPWQNLGTGSSVTDQSTPASTGQTPSDNTPSGQTSSSASNNGQIIAKFTIPPGGQITGTDGAGRTFQATADDNGYVAIPGSPGSWKLTASAPGYKTLTIDHQYSGSEVYGGNGYVGLGLQKDEAENQGPMQAFAYFSVQKGGVSGTVLVPGATITVQDGAGKIIQQAVDSEGHATIAGTTGVWQYAITAPGYTTQKGYLSLSSGSTTSSIAYLQPDESGQSKVEPVSFAPLQNQVTVKFQVAPGTTITGTDGAGNGIQKTADENGYIIITASPGNWQWTASALGYVTSGPFNYLFTSDSNMSLPQTRDTSSQPAPVSSPPPIDQQSVDQQPAYDQPASQIQNGDLSREEKDDMSINLLESRTQGRELSEQEANDLMDELDALNSN